VAPTGEYWRSAAVSARPGLSPTPRTGSATCHRRHRHRLSGSMAQPTGDVQRRWRSRQPPHWARPQPGCEISTHRPHRHHAQQAGWRSESAWIVRVAECPYRHTMTPAAGELGPKRHTIRPPARLARRHAPRLPHKPRPPPRQQPLEPPQARPASRRLTRQAPGMSSGRPGCWPWGPQAPSIEPVAPRARTTVAGGRESHWRERKGHVPFEIKRDFFARTEGGLTWWSGSERTGVAGRRPRWPRARPNSARFSAAGRRSRR
jgi:hypothetical protein